ncbi:L-type lectin-domain containing protein [Actinoplanes sp. NPDC023714]|uniref:L-type lectin-domain containing protein n=1 Tax=Actinoplanes sp. NPDC023714 TaxID=3154322 RepID=UPI0033FD0403
MRSALALKALVTSCLAVVLTPAAAARADTADAPDPGAFTLNGTAAFVTATGNPDRARVLRLTGGGFRQAGSAWATDQVDVTLSFDTTFVAYLHRGTRGADGIAFLLQRSGPRALGGWGGGLGYRGVKNSVAVEFDDFRNVGDPAGDHVGLVLNNNPDFHAAVAETPEPLFGRPFRARITYDAGSHRLTVAVDGRQLIQQTVDLAAHLGGNLAWAGFTGATGESVSKQDIRSWSGF